jgi:hypothetical protein
VEGATHFKILLSLAASLAIADPAGAVLEHYGVHRTTIGQFRSAPPRV